MTTTASLAADFDGTSVWIQRGGECVARFGNLAYEVVDTLLPERPITVRRHSGVEGWREFADDVWAIHRFRIPQEATPIRFHRELGMGSAIRDDAFVVPLRVLTDAFDPFAQDIWDRGVLTRESVTRAIALDDLEPEHVPMPLRDLQRAGWDARRVAHMVLYPDDTPVEVDVSVVDGSFEVSDGFHRLSAAIYRQDPGIAVALRGHEGTFDVHFSERVPLSETTDAFGPAP